MKQVMQGVTEYGENMDVYLDTTTGLYNADNHGLPDHQRQGYGRIVIVAINEGGFNSTEVDLLQLLSWVKHNRPELLTLADER